MRILFVENRYATRIYAAAAVHLLKAGHEVHWLVQNPTFAPSLGTVHRLRFPRTADLEAMGTDPLFARLLQSDRAVRNFGRQPTHYAHFIREVTRLLDEAAPDVVFGESTQLHELIAIELCRRRALPYLFPTGTRYPPSRLCFLREDTMEPVGGCGQDMPHEQALALIDGVNRRSISPSYMQAQARRPFVDHGRAATDKARIAWSWLMGERYLTPSPWRKFMVDREHTKVRQHWDALAARRPVSKRAPYVLYPLQMQPESTIDVWGLPWNDQPEIVRSAAAALAPLGCQLLVKPNPKPKYEIDARLCAVIEAAPNIVAIAQGVPMAQVFPGAAAVLSVSGTVLIEAVFAGKPALALGDHAMSRFPGVTALARPDLVASAWNQAQQELARADGRAGLELLQSLHRSSYAVELMDPLNQAQRITDEFGAAYASACLDVVAQLKAGARGPSPQSAVLPQTESTAT